MDLRQYDPVIGRWMVMDPVTHHDYSPYSAFDNNPAYWSDPSGADATSLILNGELIGAHFDGQDAIDAFLVLIGETSKAFEAQVQNSFEISTSPDDDGGRGSGNGDGKNNVKAIGGNVNGQFLNNPVGYSQTGFFFRESISGTYYSHDEVVAMILSEIERLVVAKKLMKNASYASWAQSIIGKSFGVKEAIIKDYVKVGKIKAPITVILGFFLSHQGSLISKAERSYLSTINNYVQSGSEEGIYFIKTHNAVMGVPFYESVSNSVYDASNGNNLGSMEINYFGLK